MGGGTNGTIYRIALSVGAVIGLVVVATVAFRPRGEHLPQAEGLPAFSLDARPQPGRHVFDYAGNLTHYEEGARRFLRRISERFSIDAVVVTLPALPEGTYLEKLALDLVDRWRIGEKHGGRGLLLLLLDQDKQVKLEVTYELEDVFTDAFTAHIQDLQLRAYYPADDLGTGLVAVMEEIEQRAKLKRLGNYTPQSVAKLDQALLSGGAGAKRSLDRYDGERQPGLAAPGLGKGASSPKEAWEIMLTKWAGEGSDIDVDIYTEMTKLAMGDPDKADPRTRRSVEHWREASYQVRQDGEHAVIWFGNIEGWNNAPFLFCRTPTGWKFDVVHQRRLVVMGENPSWLIEQGDYPYVTLLHDAPQSTGKDLPLAEEDRYSCQNDPELAQQIRKLERERVHRPNDIELLAALLRLNVMTGRRPNHVMPLLSQLEQQNPDNPDVYMYAAIYHVHSFFQYDTALEEMSTYVKLRPHDAVGHGFIGFLYYRLGDYEASVESLTRAIAIEPDNAYAYALMARNHTLLHQTAKSAADRERHRQESLHMLQKAANAPTPDAERVARLQTWLERRLPRSRAVQ